MFLGSLITRLLIESKFKIAHLNDQKTINLRKTWHTGVLGLRIMNIKSDFEHFKNLKWRVYHENVKNDPSHVKQDTQQFLGRQF